MEPLAPTTTVLDGRYRLVEELGRGGMATVHLAVDDRLDREVAVKLLHPHFAGDEVMLDRFHREARAAAAVEHDAVVRVHDWGVDDGRPFLVMEVVRGRTLREVLQDRGTLRPEEALTVLGPAASGLAAVHAQGLVHRDVTPGNLLVDERGMTKVGDFGLARSVAASTQTRTEVVGSPHYLSPEAVRGEQLDARADVYALGCVLLECLTGTPPFTADSPVAVAARHTTERVPTPSSRGVQVSPALDRVVRTATDPDPAARYADAQAFALALSAAVPAGPAPIDLRREPGTGIVVPTDHATTRLAELGVTRIVDVRDDPGPTRRQRLARVLRVLLVVAFLSGVGWVAFDTVLAPVVEVPDVTGRSLPEARAALTDEGFRVGTAVDERTDPEVPAGDVIGQDVLGEARQRVTTVGLVVSLGPATGTLPDLTGLSADEVEARFGALDLDLDVVRTTRNDDDVPAGAVLVVLGSDGTALGEFSTVTERERIEIVLSDGPARVAVPDLVGARRADALTALTDLGLVAEVEGTAFDDDAPEGSILGVAPSPGTQLRRGDRVELLVSSGPAPVEVPDVEGLPRDRAVAELESRGLVAEITEVPTRNPLRRGRVDTHYPSPGAEARRGDPVELFVWS